MQITVIRHLPTSWNKQQKLQGRKDIGILQPTKKVTEEIFKNKLILEKQGPFDHILSSTLKRTIQTAELYGFEPEREPLLDEFDFGAFEGKEKQLLYEKHGHDWIYAPSKLNFGEGIDALQQRIQSFLEKYQSNVNLLVFSHGTWTRALLSYRLYGHIDKMNQLSVQNNECITLHFSSPLTLGAERL